MVLSKRDFEELLGVKLNKDIDLLVVHHDLFEEADSNFDPLDEEAFCEDDWLDESRISSDLLDPEERIERETEEERNIEDGQDPFTTGL